MHQIFRLNKKNIDYKQAWLTSHLNIRNYISQSDV